MADKFDILIKNAKVRGNDEELVDIAISYGKIKEIDKSIYQATVLGSDFGSAGDQHDFGQSILNHLRRIKDDGGVNISIDLI